MPAMKRSIIASFLLSLGLGIPIGHAEDTDIYAAPTNVADNPNVLIVLDNSANWNRNDQNWPGGIKQGQAELNAIRTVIGELGDNINVGLMMLTDGSGSGKEDGAYLRFDIRAMNSDNKLAFSQQIGNPSGCTAGTNSVSQTPNCIYQNFSSNSEQIGTGATNYSHALFEAFKYFGGYTSPANVLSETAGTPVDRTHFGPARFSGNPDPKSDPAAYVNGGSDANKTTHEPPINNDNACAKNYIIFIGNGYPNGDSASSLLTGVGGDATKLPLANFSQTVTPVEELLTTTACGTYDSVSACQTAATATYGSTYSNIRCEVASTCSAGGTTSTNTSLGTAACGVYSSASACQTGLTTQYGTTYSSYSCTAGTACSYTVALDSPVTVDNKASCVPANQQDACIAWATTNYPNYSLFSCSNAEKSTCTGNDRKWVITAREQKLTGNTYTQTGITTTTVTTTSDSHKIYGTLNVATVTPTGTTSIPTDQENNWADEWAKFLYQTDVNAASGKQNVKTFTIDVIRRYTNPQDDDQTKLMMSMAKAGGGKYFNAQNETAIQNALRKIFAEIQSVNSVFASSSLPVSVNTQGTYLNQVFIGMFRPDGSARPRWVGNLKQYQFKFFGGVLNMADAGDPPTQAMSATTGFITNCAKSFWSSDSGPYWNYTGSEAAGTCTALTSNFPSAGSPSTYSDLPDGDVVEKGGAAQRLRGAGSWSGTLAASSTRYAECTTGQTPTTAACRKLLTCTGTCSSLVPFNSTNVTTLGADATSNANMVAWIRGKDVDNENDNGTTDEVRPSVHGGVVHSQPAVVDFGGTTGVIAFYGADDGVFRAVDGRKTADGGTELWGFIAPETFGRFNRLRDNGTTTPLIDFPNVLGTTAPKEYFFDGSIGVYQKPGTAWIFPTMRRGGRAIYAFDVSDPTSPTLKWRRGCFTSDTTNNADCSADWSGIGQTWSKPQVAFLRGYKDGSNNYKPVLIFGGGYDECEDTNAQVRCTTTPRKGANIWFVDADTGTVLRSYPTNYSVPGEIFLLKDTEGAVTYAYAGDTGGYVYRINVGSVDTTVDPATYPDWTSNTAASDIAIAALSEANHARKFISGPDVVPLPGYNLVSIGTGDREHPLATDYACGNFGHTTGNYVDNQFYLLKDDPSVAQSGDGIVDIVGTNLRDITANSGASIDNNEYKGWKIDFNNIDDHDCEQTVNKPLTIGGRIFFGTNQPTPTTSACANNLGIARGYQIDLATGTYVTNEYNGGGLPPSPVAGIVDVDGIKTPFLIGGTDPRGPLEAGEIVITPPPIRSRLYWYMQYD